MKKESDHKKSINIALDSIITSMKDGKEEIFAITEQINKENRQVKSDIAQVRKEIKIYNAQIEKLKKIEFLQFFSLDVYKNVWYILDVPWRKYVCF